MLSLFPTRKSATKPVRRSLWMEALEDRTCPAAPTLNYTLAESEGMLHIQGVVSDETPGSNVVIFSGATMAVATADSTGAFSVEVAATSGTISGVAYDLAE